MRTVALLLWKDVRLLINDRAALALTFAVPMVLILVFGTVLGGFGGGGPSGINLIVVDEAETAASQRLVAALERETAFRVILNCRTEEGPVSLTAEDACTLLQTNASAYRFALVLPEDFSGEGFGFRLRFLYNPQNAMESALVTGLLQRAFFTEAPNFFIDRLDDELDNLLGGEGWDRFRENIGLFALDVFGTDPGEAIAGFDNFLDELRGSPEGLFAESPGEGGDLFDSLLAIESEQIFGRGRNQAAQSMAGFAAMFLLFGLSASASSLFYDREQQILHRLLAGPASRIQIMLGKYVYGVLFGCFQLGILFAFGQLIFNVITHPAQIPLLALVALAFSGAATGFGMIICAFSRTAAQASGISTFLILTMSALGGAMIPSFLFPAFLRDYVAPLTLVHWGVDGFLAILWRDANLIGILPYLGVLLIFTLVTLAIATPRFIRDATFSR